MRTSSTITFFCQLLLLPISFSASVVFLELKYMPSKIHHVSNCCYIDVGGLHFSWSCNTSKIHVGPSIVNQLFHLFFQLIAAFFSGFHLPNYVSGAVFVKLLSLLFCAKLRSDYVAIRPADLATSPGFFFIFHMFNFIYGRLFKFGTL